MSSQVTNVNWTNILRLSICSASLAALGFWAWKYKLKHHQGDRSSLWKVISDFFASSKSATKKTFSESLENVSTSVEEWIELLKDKYLTEETQEVLDNIKVLIDNVNKFDVDGKPYLSSVFILLVILKKVQSMSEFDKWEQSLPDASDVSPGILRQVKYYSEFAFNVYDAAKLPETQFAGIAETMSVAEEDVIVCELQDDEGEGICPKFVFFVDHKSKSIVLAVRGTKSLRDALLDMVCDDAPFLGGSAHSGILKGAKRVWNLVAESVAETCKKYPDYLLVLTGHSLGAGVVVLLSLDILQGELASDLPQGTEVQCYAFAPPPVFRPGPDINDLPYGVRDKILIVINNHDCIPRTSLGSLARLLSSLRAVDDVNLSLRQQMRIIMDGDPRNRITETNDLDDDNLKDREKSDKEVSELMDKLVKAVNVARQDTFPYLQHPGKIIYLKQKREDSQKADCGDDVDDSHVALSVDSLRVPHRLLLLADMVSDHRRPGYRHALLSLQGAS